jgi:hypothetical protein
MEQRLRHRAISPLVPINLHLSHSHCARMASAPTVGFPNHRTAGREPLQDVAGAPPPSLRTDWPTLSNPPHGCCGPYQRRLVTHEPSTFIGLKIGSMATGIPLLRRDLCAASNTLSTRKPSLPSLSGCLCSRTHSRKCSHSSRKGSSIFTWGIVMSPKRRLTYSAKLL